MFSNSAILSSRSQEHDPGILLATERISGDDVSLHVATDTPQFRVDIYRQGATFDKLISTGWNDGQDFPGEDHAPADDWSVDGTGVDANGNPQGFAAGWKGLTITIPAEWTSGIYIAVLVPGDGSGDLLLPLPNVSNGDARDGKALLVVRNPNPGVNSQLLYKLPLFTYQSYNSVNKYLPLPGGGYELVSCIDSP